MTLSKLFIKLMKVTLNKYLTYFKCSTVLSVLGLELPLISVNQNICLILQMKTINLNK